MLRRTFISAIGCALPAASFALGAIAGESGSGNTTERQKGDPNVPYEFVTFDGSMIRSMAERSEGRATFQPWDKNLPAKMLTTAQDLVGVSRDTHPQQVAEFLDLFHEPFKDSRGYVAFCAAGLSYCALWAFAANVFPNLDMQNKLLSQYQFRSLMPDVDHYYFYPTVSCIDMFYIAAGRHRWVDRAQEPKVVPKPGWVVLFDWSKSGMPDHCGFVVFATEAALSTVEFNTSGPSGGSQRNGGTVALKSRGYEYVRGYIRTDTVPE